MPPRKPAPEIPGFTLIDWLGGGGFADRLLGTVSSALPAHAHCPAIVVPRHTEGSDYTPVRRIVVGVDGSDSAPKALRWAGKAENQKFFASEVQPFMKEAAAILLESGVIRQLPQTYDGLADPQFIR